MSEENVGDEHEDRGQTLFEFLKKRWYIVLIVLVVLGLCALLCPTLAQNSEVVAGYFEQFFGGGNDETTPPPEDETTREGPPPTDEPTSTTEPTETEEVATGSGTCNDTCQTAADCLAGLNCLPVPGAGYSVCWTDAICNPDTSGDGGGDGGGAVCGNGSCETGESPAACPADCGLCGNGVCDPGEHVYNCSADCGEPPPPPTTDPCASAYCGNGICESACGESSFNCGDCFY